MTEKIIPQWLNWAREIQALAQTNTMYAENDYQRERSARLTEIAAEIIHQHTHLPLPALIDNFKAQPGYATPKVDVRGAVFKDGKLLMVQERMDMGWTMPGGWADVGDVPSEAAEREVWEEAGFKVKATKVIGVYDANRVREMVLYHAFKVVFLCDLISGEARPSMETADVQFFGRDEIPQILSGERTKVRHIDHAFAAWEAPDSPTIFD